jgi:tetratricopeptide (TPR) repeat protein
MKTVCFALGLALASGWIARSTLPVQNRQPDAAELGEQMEQSAAASIVGGFRSTVSGYLWMKADEYLHGGAAMRRLTEGEMRRNDARLASTQSPDGSDPVQHHNETSEIPHPDNDKRVGWGEIERSVKPWVDPKNHRHVNLRETIPLYQFMTWVDPTFVSAYVVGAHVIYSSDKSKINEVIAWLQKGVQASPKSVALQTELGRYLAEAQRFDDAQIRLQTAITLGESAHDLTASEDDALQDAFRWMILIQRKLGDNQRERLYALRALKRFPNDPIALHTVNPRYVR